MFQGMEWNFKPSLKRFGTNFVSEHNRYDITYIARSWDISENQICRYASYLAYDKYDHVVNEQCFRG